MNAAFALTKSAGSVATEEERAASRGRSRRVTRPNVSRPTFFGPVRTVTSPPVASIATITRRGARIVTTFAGPLMTLRPPGCRRHAREVKSPGPVRAQFQADSVFFHQLRARRADSRHVTGGNATSFTRVRRTGPRMCCRDHRDGRRPVPGVESPVRCVRVGSTGRRSGCCCRTAAWRGHGRWAPLFSPWPAPRRFRGRVVAVRA